MSTRKKPDIVRLAKGMPLEDKAKLIFADLHKQEETAGLQRILSPDEEQALIDDAREQGQIADLNRLNKLYRINVLLLGDLQTTYLEFRKEENLLLGFLLGQQGYVALINALDEIEHYAKETGAHKDVLDAIARHRKSQTELDKDASLAIFKNTFTEATKGMIVNPMRRKIYGRIINDIKAYRRVRHMQTFLRSIARIDMLSDEEKKKVKEWDEGVDIFLKGEIYHNDIKHTEDETAKALLKDVEAGLPLTPKERDEAEATLVKVIDRDKNSV